MDELIRWWIDGWFEPKSGTLGGAYPPSMAMPHLGRGSVACCFCNRLHLSKGLIYQIHFTFQTKHHTIVWLIYVFIYQELCKMTSYTSRLYYSCLLDDIDRFYQFEFNRKGICTLEPSPQCSSAAPCAVLTHSLVPWFDRWHTLFVKISFLTNVICIHHK